MASLSPDQLFNKHVRELIGAMKTLADRTSDTAELMVIEQKYKFATKLNDTLLLDIIIDQKFFDVYHDQILGRDTAFFLTSDFTENLRRYERAAKYKENSYEEWLKTIDILRRVWTSVDDATREDMWDRVEDIYMAYLKYVEARDNAKK